MKSDHGQKAAQQPVGKSADGGASRLERDRAKRARVLVEPDNGNVTAKGCVAAVCPEGLYGVSCHDSGCFEICRPEPEKSSAPMWRVGAKAQRAPDHSSPKGRHKSHVKVEAGDFLPDSRATGHTPWWLGCPGPPAELPAVRA